MAISKGGGGCLVPRETPATIGKKAGKAKKAIHKASHQTKSKFAHYWIPTDARPPAPMTAR